MKLRPYTAVDGLPFNALRDDVLRHHGVPQATRRNIAALDELDYGDRVFRFQDNGRLEEVTRRAPVLYLVGAGGVTDLPFASLPAFVRQHDADAFGRAGFVVSPRYGFAFVPGEPDWVTTLAAHCIDTWCAM